MKIDQRLRRGGSVSLQSWQRVLAGGLLILGVWAATAAPNAWAQQSGARQVTSKVTPSYPELARRMRIAGVVKVQLTVAPVGTVKDAKIMGGHPVLANSVLDAVRKWRYQAGRQETTENLEFRFDPND
jgi:TonB family protein